MIWLLVPLAAVCMGYIAWWVLNLLPAATGTWTWGIEGPGLPPYRPVTPPIRPGGLDPDDRPPPTLTDFDRQLLADIEKWRNGLVPA